MHYHFIIKFYSSSSVQVQNLQISMVNPSEKISEKSRTFTEMTWYSENFKHATFFFSLYTGTLTKTDAEETSNLQGKSFYILSFVALISNVIIVVATILKYYRRQPAYGYQKIQSSY